MIELLLSQQFWSTMVALFAIVVVVHTAINRDIPELKSDVRALKQSVATQSVVLERHSTLLGSMKDDIHDIKRSLQNGHGHS